MKPNPRLSLILFLGIGVLMSFSEVCMGDVLKKEIMPFRQVRWGMSKRDVKGLEKKQSILYGEKDDFLCFGNAHIDWGIDSLKDYLESTFIAYHFAQDRLVKIQFPYQVAFNETAARQYYEELRTYLTGKYGNPLLESPDQTSCQWLTGATYIRMSIDKEVGGVFSEQVMSGFRYHHDAAYWAHAYKHPHIYIRFYFERKN